MKLKKIYKNLDNIDCTIIEAKSWIQTHDGVNNKHLKKSLKNIIYNSLNPIVDMKDSIIDIKFNEKEISNTQPSYFSSYLYIFDDNINIESVIYNTLTDNKLIKVYESNKHKKRK